MLIISPHWPFLPIEAPLFLMEMEMCIRIQDNPLTSVSKSLSHTKGKRLKAEALSCIFSLSSDSKIH